jgi:hypothetical protein
LFVLIKKNYTSYKPNNSSVYLQILRTYILMDLLTAWPPVVANLARALAGICPANTGLLFSAAVCCFLLLGICQARKPGTTP